MYINSSIKTVDGSFSNYGDWSRTVTVTVSVPSNANIVGAGMIYAESDGHREEAQNISIGAINKNGTTVTIAVNLYSRHGNTLSGTVRLFYL